ncbi:hypothetical protein QR680_017494 [Steinernema hermaphroditum]|uniref:Ribosomal protein eL8/eL30/eS12/Gadd45 domain-containing protein n=1 Tax=Steinernema hermaphroditum TaxID=289476 RepID=A0AA39HGY8_9BILA|nr:hypothetical protein QR680_017494 [Steinernema hermaphroditum]
MSVVRTTTHSDRKRDDGRRRTRDMQPSGANALDANPPARTFRGVQKPKKASTLKQNVLELRYTALSVPPPTTAQNPLDEAVLEFLKALFTFQNRLFHENQTKAHAKRRYVCGFHEVSKFLKSEDVKMVVMATNIENFSQPDGDEQRNRLAETVEGIEVQCSTQNVLLVKACIKRRLGKVLKKTSPVSVVGVLRPDGAEELWSRVLQHVDADGSNIPDSQ